MTPIVGSSKAKKRYRPVVTEGIGHSWEASVAWGDELVWSSGEQFAKDTDAYQVARSKATEFETTGEGF